jgi:PAS domain S-box-containing protein
MKVDHKAFQSGIIDSAMDAIITLDGDLHIQLFNAAVEQMFRCLAADMMGQPIDRLLPERFRSAHSEHIRRFGLTGVTNRAMGAMGAISGLRAGGEEFPLRASISQVHIVDKNCSR